MHLYNRQPGSEPYVVESLPFDEVAYWNQTPHNPVPVELFIFRRCFVSNLWLWWYLVWGDQTFKCFVHLGPYMVQKADEYMSVVLLRKVFSKSLATTSTRNKSLRVQRYWRGSSALLVICVVINNRKKLWPDLFSLGHPSCGTPCLNTSALPSQLNLSNLFSKLVRFFSCIFFLVLFTRLFKLTHFYLYKLTTTTSCISCSPSKE